MFFKRVLIAHYNAFGATGRALLLLVNVFFPRIAGAVHRHVRGAEQ